MNPDTSLLSMTADSTQPENMTNVLSDTTAVIKPGGLAADSLFNVKSEKVIVPKIEVATKLEPAKAEAPTPKPESSTQPAHSTTTPKDLPAQTTTHPLLGLSQFQMNKVPAPGMDVRLPYNSHLAALMKQYEMMAHNTKIKPNPIGAELESDLQRRQKEPTPPKSVGPIGPIQPVLQMPRNFPPMTLHDANLLNFGLTMPGYGWPMLPYANPFAPNFMQCFYPPLQMLQNPLGFQPTSQAPLPPTTPLVTNGNSQNKKRKAPTSMAPKTQIKRAKEIEPDAFQMDRFSDMPKLQPCQFLFPSVPTAFKLT